ncbi:MAG: hemerythrin domain-containing protein [Oligoflexia bacterium]|nr:hemerythrin domain-containing protein [Oligoflexia bacterium]
MSTSTSLGGPFRPAQSTATDPVAWLVDCHARIEKVVAGLGALSRAALDDPRAAVTAQACHRYLQLALPLHAQDEDESLVPPLLAAPSGAALGGALDRMQAEHQQIVLALPGALILLDHVVNGLAVGTGELHDLAEWADGLLLPHIHHEEQVILPAVGRLSPDILDQIARQMRARRATPGAAETR